MLAVAGVPYLAPGRDELDITDKDALQQMIEGSGPGCRPVSAVIHTAAMTRVDACEIEQAGAYAVNGWASEQIARICGRHRIPLVYLSTDFVFDGSQGVPYQVHDAPRPLNVYGSSKLAGEEAVRRLADLHYVVRTSWVYGIHGHNFPRAILQAAVTGQPLTVVNDQVGSPTYARDLAGGVLSLLGVGSTARPAPCGTYHITNIGSCSWYEFAREILHQARWHVDVRPVSSAELGRAARRPAYSVLSLDGLDDTGVAVRPWRRALSAFMKRLRLMAPELHPREADLRDYLFGWR